MKTMIGRTIIGDETLIFLVCPQCLFTSIGYWLPGCVVCTTCRHHIEFTEEMHNAEIEHNKKHIAEYAGQLTIRTRIRVTLEFWMIDIIKILLFNIKKVERWLTDRYMHF